jgi:hypothetical protein
MQFNFLPKSIEPGRIENGYGMRKFEHHYLASGGVLDLGQDAESAESARINESVARR